MPVSRPPPHPLCAGMSECLRLHAELATHPCLPACLPVCRPERLRLHAELARLKLDLLCQQVVKVLEGVRGALDRKKVTEQGGGGCLRACACACVCACVRACVCVCVCVSVVGSRGEIA